MSSGRGRDLYPEQLVSENVPEDGEEEEGDEGEDEDPPGALFMQRFLIAPQDQQPHADAHHCARQMSHETGLRSGRGEGRRKTQPYGTAHLRTHCERQRLADVWNSILPYYLHYQSNTWNNKDCSKKSLMLTKAAIDQKCRTNSNIITI